MMPTCRGCHAVIRWIKTRNGAACPVDPELLTEWLTEGPIYWTTSLSVEEAEKWAKRTGLTWPLKHRALLTPEGDTVTGYQASPLTMHAREVTGYIPHWQTCLQAKAFKR